MFDGYALIYSYLFGFIFKLVYIGSSSNTLVVAEFTTNILALVQIDPITPRFGAHFDSRLSGVGDSNQKYEHQFKHDEVAQAMVRKGCE